MMFSETTAAPHWTLLNTKSTRKVYPYNTYKMTVRGQMNQQDRNELCTLG